MNTCHVNAIDCMDDSEWMCLIAFGNEKDRLLRFDNTGIVEHINATSAQIQSHVKPTCTICIASSTENNPKITSNQQKYD